MPVERWEGSGDANADRNDRGVYSFSWLAKYYRLTQLKLSIMNYELSSKGKAGMN